MVSLTEYRNILLDQYYEWIHAVIDDINNETTTIEVGIDKIFKIDSGISRKIKRAHELKKFQDWKGEE